ncbi:MAG: alpha-galactosidase [Planctomycetes bacterium]|nr:alpha-galactosidase [Planctomycetota bacterium]
MTHAKKLVHFVTLCCALAWATLSSGSDGGLTDITLREGPEPEVRFTSGKAIYVEALAGGRWIGRCWNASGRIESPGWRRVELAFQIEVKEEPTANRGASLENGWQWVSAGEVPGAQKGGRHYMVVLSNRILPITVKLHTLLDGTAVLTRWLEISNTSGKTLALTAVAPWAGRLWDEDAPTTLGCSIIQSNQQTGSFGWRVLESGLTTIRNTREPCYDDPYFILRNESKGEYFFGQLAWPSIYRMEFLKKEGLTFRIDPLAVGGALRVVAPGETIETPAVHLCHSKSDFDAVVQEMHDHIRRSVLFQRRPELSNRIEYIANGDTGTCLYKGDDFNESNLRPCVDVAAAVGAELFLIDGPFWAEKGSKRGGRQDGDLAEMDDWDGWSWLEASKKLFPSGLRALREYARQRGILFGVYARTEGRRMLESGDPDMFEIVCDMIEKHKLDLYRHDTSSNQWSDWVHSKIRDGFEECILWRHHETFYRAAERIHEKYPNVILQQAAGGGARSDLATAARWHENFQSDLTPAPLVYQMMAGFSVYLPPEIMQSAYHGMWGTTMPDKTTMLRCIYALGNTPCIYWTQLPGKIDEIKPEELKEWRKYSDIFKTFIRPLLPSCKVYHHAPINAKDNWDSGPWFVMEFVSPDRKKGWAMVVSYPKNQSLTYLFRPRGLDAQKKYKVTFDNTSMTELFAGSSLMREGLVLKLAAEPASELLLFEAQE